MPSFTFDNTAPGVVLPPRIISVIASATGNVSNLATACPATVDGVSLSGRTQAAGATLDTNLILLRAQTTGSQNGIYYPAAGTPVSISASYSGGAYSLTGLSAGVLYLWEPGANDTSVTNGSVTLTSRGLIAADGSGVLTLAGTGTSSVTATVAPAILSRPTNLNGDDELMIGARVYVEGGSTYKGYQYELTAIGSGGIGTGALTFTLATADPVYPLTGFSNVAPEVITPTP